MALSSSPSPSLRSVSRALIACGGFGTRLLPLTKALPKALIPVVDRCLLQYAVEESVRAGIREIGVLYRADQVAIPTLFETPSALVAQLERLERRAQLDALRRFDAAAQVRLFPGSDEASGLGGQILEVADFLAGEPFALLFVDELCDPAARGLEKLLEVFATCGLTVAGAVGDEEDEVFLVSAIPVLGDPAPSPRAGAGSGMRLIGRFICPPTVLTALQAIGETEGVPIDFMDALRLLAGSRLLAACPFPGRWWDCGSRSGLLAANLTLATEDAELGSDVRQGLLAPPGGGS